MSAVSLPYSQTPPQTTTKTTTVRKDPSLPDDAALASIEREEQQQQAHLPTPPPGAPHAPPWPPDTQPDTLPASFDLYLGEARRSAVARTPLSRQQQFDLARAGHTNVLAESALFLVVAEAEHMVTRELARAPLCTDVLDLLQELVSSGNIGLARAALGYDWRRGFAFSTYATWCIRNEMQHAMSARRRERSQAVSLDVLKESGQDVAAPDLVLEDATTRQAPPSTTYQRYRHLNADLAALQSMRLISQHQMLVLSLILGAHPPFSTQGTPGNWSPPPGWTPGMQHSIRLVARLLGRSHPTVIRSLEATERALYTVEQSGTIPYASVAHRILALLVAPGPKMRSSHLSALTKNGGIRARSLTCKPRDAMVGTSARAP